MIPKLGVVAIFVVFLTNLHCSKMHWDSVKVPASATALTPANRSRDATSTGDGARPVPRFLITREAFVSRSMVKPHLQHWCTRLHKFFGTNAPQTAHSWEVPPRDPWGWQKVGKQPSAQLLSRFPLVRENLQLSKQEVTPARSFLNGLRRYCVRDASPQANGCTTADRSRCAC